jgi:CRISPR-associated protein Csh2
MLAKRSEILFYYDAKMSNPNGDPDENRPRIDRITKKNYVTEFRLKRTIRDYLLKVLGKKIFMRPELVSPKSLALKEIKDLASDYIVKGGNGKNPKIERTKLLKDHIDIKLFGILFAVGDLHFKQIGPIQFSIGQSLNKVEEMQIRMTRVVPTKAGAESGTFGEKYIVRYSFIEFHGFVNNNVAKEVDLGEEDVTTMLAAMWKGTSSLSTSSKFGQQSRLLVKVNYKDDGYIGDLDSKSKLEAKTDPLENISQVTLDTSELFDILSKNKDVIDSVEYEDNAELICKSDGEEESSFEKLVKNWAGKNNVRASRLNL